MVDERKEPLYSIGKVAKITGLTIPSIRYYDRIGLVVPAVRDDETGYRYYTETQIMSFYNLRELKAIGLDLEQITTFLKDKNPKNLQDAIGQILADLRQEMKDLERKLHATEKVYHEVVEGRTLLDENLFRKMEETELLNYSVTDIEEGWILSTRKIEPLDADVLFVQRCLELQELRNQYGLLSTGPFFAIFHSGYEDQFQKKMGDMELCLRVTGPAEKECPELRLLRSYKAAGAIFIGPYADLEGTYLKLLDRIEQDGYRVVGPAMELYLLDPLATDDASQYVTRIEFPVERK